MLVKPVWQMNYLQSDVQIIMHSVIGNTYRRRGLANL